jgi:hypothetical protein
VSCLYEVIGKRLQLNLHPGQVRAWNSTKRIVAIVSGTQGGKTAFLPLWLWREIRRCGPGDYAFISPTFALMELKALPEFKRLFEQVLRLGTYTASPIRRFVFSAEGSRRLFGSVSSVPTVVYFGYADNPDSLESATYKAVALDEAGQKAFRQQSWEAIQRRLAIHQGRACIGTTPYSATGWLKTEIVDKAKLPNSEVDLIQFASIMNPAFPRAEFERAKSILPRWKFDMFYRGLLTRPAGLIYDCFDPDVHRVPRFDIPDHWPRTLGLDFGGVNTAGVFVASELQDLDGPDREGRPMRRPTGRHFAYREYHAGSRTAAEHVAVLKHAEPMTPTCVGGSKSEGQWRAEFRKGGLPVREPPVSEVEVGIDRVYGLLKRNQLFFFDDLTRTLDQLQNYSRVVDEQGEPTEEIADKASFHEADALRYLAAWLDRPKPNTEIHFLG